MLIGADTVKDGNGMVKAAIEGVESWTSFMHNTIMSLKDAEAKLKAASDSQAIVCNKMGMIGERMLILGLSNLIVVMLVLMVLVLKCCL